MPILRAFVLTIILAGCGTSPETSSAEADSSAANYQYVGTYEHFATPMGGSVSVLMADGEKIKIVSTDDTSYINMAVNNGIPELRISGTYGINGDLRRPSFAIGELFIVREIAYIGGGQDSGVSRHNPVLPDFFTVDGDARGALTLSELQIRFPESLARFFNSEERECFNRQVAFRARDMGDPVTMPPIRRVLLSASEQQWEGMTNAEKRLQLARYVTSMALSDC